MPPLLPRLQAAAGAILVAAILAGAAYTVRDFLPALAWAAVLAIGLWPVHLTLQRRLSCSGQFSALGLTGAIALVFILPITFLSIRAAADLGPLLQWVNETSQTGLPAPHWLNLLPFGRAEVIAWWNNHLATGGALKQTYTSLQHNPSLQHGPLLALHAAHQVVLIFFTILTLFFLLKDGAQLAARGQDLSMQLVGPTGEAIFVQIINSVRGTISGLVLVGLGEGIAIGISYFAFGIGYAPLLTIVTAVAAMLPYGALVVLGLAAFIALAQSRIAALCIIAYGSTVIFVADHFVRPKLIGGATKIPFLLVLFGILGGFESWGLIGLFVGPALMAVVTMFWQQGWAALPPASPDRQPGANEKERPRDS
ncbi:MAG TPA: AI-2E family transporter [Acidocella sp.]|jgi:predicted PurR-regulated permease PerM|nr:AI-2E family transporter [Acidocella sp.]